MNMSALLLSGAQTALVVILVILAVVVIGALLRLVMLLKKPQKAEEEAAPAKKPAKSKKAEEETPKKGKKATAKTKEEPKKASKGKKKAEEEEPAKKPAAKKASTTPRKKAEPKERIIVVQAQPQYVYVQADGQVVQGAVPAPTPVVVTTPAGAPAPVVVTTAPAPVNAPALAPAKPTAPVEDDEDIDDDLIEETGPDGSKVTYNRSFMAKYIQAPDDVKNWYVHLKNRLLAYKKVRSNTSWKRESFICGRKPMARIVFRGKTMCLFLPLDPSAFAETKYHVENVANMTMYTDTPCMYRIKNERRLEYAYELLDMVAKDLGTTLSDVPEKDYYLPYEGTLQLIDKGLVKRVIRPGDTSDYINP